jgi:predicted nucleotidyltransferase
MLDSTPATSALPSGVRDAVLDLRERLATRFGARRQVLRVFGSYARGEAGPESDVDVLVVVDGLLERERREVFDLAEDVFFERLVHLSPLALSDREYRTLREREYLIVREIDRDGVEP